MKSQDAVSMVVINLSDVAHGELVDKRKIMVGYQEGDFYSGGIIVQRYSIEPRKRNLILRHKKLRNVRHQEQKL